LYDNEESNMRTVEDSVGFLLVGICRAHRNQAAALLRRVGVYVGQEWILFRLRDEEGMTQSELAETCNVEGPTMSKALQRMEGGGIVTRREDSADARVSRIYLTAKGRALCAQVEDCWKELERRTVAHLSTEERILVRRLLLQIQSNLNDG
jgi:MarR family transcriptional regulator, organic hydroperoxide resistance regulator